MTKEQKRLRCERAKAWIAAHPEQAKETRRKYYENNRTALGIKHKKWADANKDRCIAAQRRFHALRPWYNNYLMARARCTKPAQPGYRYYGNRGIKFMLTQGDVIMLWERDNASQTKDPSIDRIDSIWP